MSDKPRPYRNNYRRREEIARQRQQRPKIKKEEKSPLTIGMIFRIALMIITAGIMGRN